jgi:hypothetical protein
MTSKDTFTDELLIALSNWQNGWRESQARRRSIADKLVEQCKELPEEFKAVSENCYRKRFINEGEVVPIILDNDFFEGIASWTEKKACAKGFKGIVRPSSKFVMLFNHKPLPDEIVVNIVRLWKDKQFQEAADDFKKKNQEAVKALFHFKDLQSEVVLRSTLRGSEIEDIVGISNSFEEICNMGGIPEEKREELSIKYAKNPEGLPIEVPTYAGSKATKEAIRKTIEKMKDTLLFAKENNVLVNWSRVAIPHKDDLKHRRQQIKPTGNNVYKK